MHCEWKASDIVERSPRISAGSFLKNGSKGWGEQVILDLDLMQLQVFLRVYLPHPVSAMKTAILYYRTEVVYIRIYTLKTDKRVSSSTTPGS